MSTWVKTVFLAFCLALLHVQNRMYTMLCDEYSIWTVLVYAILIYLYMNNKLNTTNAHFTLSAHHFVYHILCYSFAQSCFCTVPSQCCLSISVNHKFLVCVKMTWQIKHSD